MNRYPVWKYVLILIALVVCSVYTLPNFFGEVPALQISSGKPTVRIDARVVSTVEQTLKSSGIAFDGISANRTASGSGSRIPSRS